MGHVPLHAVIGEVGERISECRQFPVEHREDARLGLVQNHVVEPVVAMHQPHRAGRRQVSRQPCHDALHLLDLLGLGGAVLLRPAVDLTRDVVLAAAVVGEPDCRGVIGMQPRKRRVHGVEHRGAFGGVRARHVGHPNHAALDITHHVERRARDALVGTVDNRLGDREALGRERADDLVLAIDCVRRGEQFSGRLSAQHVSARGRFEIVGRVRLAALELPYCQRTFEAGCVRREVCFQSGGIEAQRRRHLLGARIGRLPVDLGHG